VASGLRREGYCGRPLVLNLRDSRFRTMSKQRTLPAATNATQVIYEAALALLADLYEPGCLLRLLGLTMSGLTQAHQTALDSGRAHACDEAVDLVRSRFGPQALRRAGGDLVFGEDQPRAVEDSEKPPGEPCGD
jgi:DNA polymerase-4